LRRGTNCKYKIWHTTNHTTVTPEFFREVKVTSLPKLKYETQWRAFNCKTAAGHLTMDVVNPQNVPPIQALASFQYKQWYKYNFVTNVIHTTKGKNCIREESTSLDAQKVYASLLIVYHDHLSTNLSPTKHCKELTLMKLDDNWRRSFASFLHLWTAKVQDLTCIEDKLVDDDTKHLHFRLTNTLCSQPDHQTSTTELTMNGTQGSATTMSIPWTNFYILILSIAKLLDTTRSTQLGRRQETNKANSQLKQD
jgi:hypothetical protein